MALYILTAHDIKVLGKEGVHVLAVCPHLLESNLKGRSQQQIIIAGAVGELGSRSDRGRQFCNILEVGESEVSASFGFVQVHPSIREQ